MQGKIAGTITYRGVKGDTVLITEDPTGTAMFWIAKDGCVLGGKIFDFLAPPKPAHETQGTPA